MSSCWIRFPAVRGDRLVFVTDDDVFGAPVGGGSAQRLTSGAGTALRPRLSPDGARLTWDSTAEGARDVWSAPASGGAARRVTWGGATNLGFDPRGRLLVSTSQDQPFLRSTVAATVGDDGLPTTLPFGPLVGLAGSPSGRLALCRHATELGTWRGYRGGRMGVLWLGIPRSGDPDDWHGATFAWEKVQLPCAAAHPTWHRGRFWFVGDPGPSPELCSVDEAGGDLRVHTALGGFGVRHPDSDGETLVFVHDGVLLRWTDDGPSPIDIDVPAQRGDRQRRAFGASRAVEDVDLHPDGHSIAVLARGRVSAMGFWEGPVRPIAGGDGTRHLLPRWVDRERLATVSDRDGEYRVELHGPRGPERRFEHDHGRPVLLELDPTGRRAVLADHRHHLWLLELESGAWTHLDHAPPGGFEVDWSADGGWLAWSRPVGVTRSQLRLREVATGRTVDLTDGGWQDRCPSFDPDGNHLYFLSLRDFDPVADTVSFGYAFARGTRPYCVTLRRDLPHPFRPEPRPLKAPSGKKDAERPPLVIDLEGLTTRIVPFPISEARYGRVLGVGAGNVLLTREPVRGMLDRDWSSDVPQTEATLCLWDADRQELVELSTRMGALRADRRRDHVVFRSGWRLRVALARPDKAAREELKKPEGRAERKTGWLDLARVRDEVDPELEWPQMIRDAHRLLRDHFWREPDEALLAATTAARDRALAALPRISTRGELSDLLLSLLGTWGTSHAYEIGGDLPPVPTRRVGRLGADVSWEPVLGGWRLDRVLPGDVGTERSSPLLAPGATAAVGDVILRVDGRRVTPDRPLAAWLVDRAATPVALELGRPDDGATRTVTVVPLPQDRELRYREWVLERRRRVTQRSAGRVGYLHVPNMGPIGFAEFHRDLADAIGRDALLVDVRFNGGGHVSQLLLKTLTQRRLGRKDPRHGPPLAYPLDAPPPVMACLANEAAGSDGDIFTHAWKVLGLGPVYGTRTWGGVVGISPRFRLVDRTLLTQPEYATWFPDVGYGLENQGVPPDVEVEVPPDVAATDEDPALELAVAHLIRRLAEPPVGTTTVLG
jgi:tricorn protease